MSATGGLRRDLLSFLLKALGGKLFFSRSAVFYFVAGLEAAQAFRRVPASNHSVVCGQAFETPPSCLPPKPISECILSSWILLLALNASCAGYSNCWSIFSPPVASLYFLPFFLSSATFRFPSVASDSILCILLAILCPLPHHRIPIGSRTRRFNQHRLQPCLWLFPFLLLAAYGFFSGGPILSFSRWRVRARTVLQV